MTVSVCLSDLKLVKCSQWFLMLNIPTLSVNVSCRLKFTISLRYVPDRVTQHFEIHCSQMMTHPLFYILEWNISVLELLGALPWNSLHWIIRSDGVSILVCDQKLQASHQPQWLSLIGKCQLKAPAWAQPHNAASVVLDFCSTPLPDYLMAFPPTMWFGTT